MERFNCIVKFSHFIPLDKGYVSENLEIECYLFEDSDFTIGGV